MVSKIGQAETADHGQLLPIALRIIRLQRRKMRIAKTLNERPWRALCVTLLLAFIAFSISPAGYHGGPSDDAQYLAAAREWLQHRPWLGTTHWALRHPLVLSIAGALRIGGSSIGSAMCVPTLFGMIFAGAGFAALFRLVSPRVAWLWLALALLNPIIHRMGTSLYPEIVELTLGTVGLALVGFALRKERGDVLLVAAGIAFGLATLTRETTALMAPLVAYIVFRYAGWRGVVAVAAGALVPVVADTLFLHAMSGDWLYRLHVDSSHTHIASAHLRGGTYAGRVFFNPDLAARWIPAGPAKIHWAINPLIDFLIDPRFGFLVVGWIIAFFAFRSTAVRSEQRFAVALALLSYIGVCWVLMLRPQPRYFLFVMLAASVAVALLLDRAWDGPRRLWAKRLFALLLVAGLVAILRQHDYERLPRMVMPYLRAHPGTYHSDPVSARRINEWLVNDGISARLVDTPAKPGDLILRRQKLAPPPNEQREQLDVLDGHGLPAWGLRGFRKPRPMIVERRLR